MTVERVDVAPATLQWAVERSRRDLPDLVKKLPKLPDWLAGQASPTLRQLGTFADSTYTPLGLLLLPEPLEEKLPVPDFRTFADDPVARPSANLLDTLALCLERQDWYRDYARSMELPRVEFVGSLVTTVPVKSAADLIAERLDFSIESRARYASFAEALRGLVEQAEQSGVLVMVSGVVASNTNRILDRHEFRGFALADELAPVIFINGTDSKAAQIFTLAHELAHLWLGESGVSDPAIADQAAGGVERWCNQVAAELLVPEASFLENVQTHRPITDQLQTLAQLYRVSSLVILRRALDTGLLARPAFIEAYVSERDRILALDQDKSPGGDFYSTQPVRTSKRLMRAVLAETLEGRTLYRDAFHLLSFRSSDALSNLADRLGVR